MLYNIYAPSCHLSNFVFSTEYFPQIPLGSPISPSCIQRTNKFYLCWPFPPSPFHLPVSHMRWIIVHFEFCWSQAIVCRSGLSAYYQVRNKRRWTLWASRSAFTTAPLCWFPVGEAGWGSELVPWPGLRSWGGQWWSPDAVFPLHITLVWFGWEIDLCPHNPNLFIYFFHYLHLCLYAALLSLCLCAREPIPPFTSCMQTKGS